MHLFKINIIPYTVANYFLSPIRITKYEKYTDI